MAEHDKHTEAHSATTGAAVEEASSTTRSGRPRGVDGESAGQSTTTQQRSGTGTAVAGRQDISAVLPTSRWELMRRLTEDLTGLFDSFGGGASTVPARRTGILTWIPRIEVQQQNNALIVRADLPGMGADNVEVTVENGMLVISGERRQQQIGDAATQRAGAERDPRDHRFHSVAPDPILKPHEPLLRSPPHLRRSAPYGKA